MPSEIMRSAKPAQLLLRVSDYVNDATYRSQNAVTMLGHYPALP